MTTIYIPLLDEGVAVVRPTQGVSLRGDVFLVLPTSDYDPELETWAFLPGSSVFCVAESFGGEDVLVARELAAGKVTTQAG